MQGDRRPTRDKDQGTQAQPGPSAGPVTPPTHTGGEAHTPGTVRPGLKAPFRHQEERASTQKRKNPGKPPKRSLATRLSGASAPSPPSTQGPAGRKATQWLDRMLLWVALHQDQFDEEEQMDHHQGRGKPPTTIPALTAKFKEAFADPNAKRAAARKIAALTQTTTTSEYVTEFRNLMAELDWNTEAYIAQFTRGLHWKVKELLSTKDGIPDDDLEAIFAASVKIDNIR
ncbi:Retrotransposon gag protein [Rhizoctonia solani]|uniref:Retrotransposon gag protein n=1 Tax=Rhizoctonia solani TaxID=456999 RepID=A0A8H7IDJ8_9AGAM|nr:Retrotransposon gag protein [Rhizoctonia solani]